MAAFLDATCPKCRNRFGWMATTDTLMERPPCPKCGHQIPADVLKRDSESLLEMREELIRRRMLKDSKP